MALNWLDITILVLVSLSTLIGLMNGFIERVFTVVGIIGSISGAVIFHDLAAELLVNYGIVDKGAGALISGFIATFFWFLLSSPLSDGSLRE